MKNITPCLWFDTNAEEAVRFYTKLFKKSKVGKVLRYGESAANVSGQPKGSVLTIEFQINGQDFLALNGGPLFKFTEAVSFMILCEDQKEVDYYWSALTKGGEEQPCGWVKDKFGLSWQVAPKMLTKLLGDKDRAKAERAMKAMLEMKKIDIATIEAAARGTTKKPAARRPKPKARTTTKKPAPKKRATSKTRR
jgi:predicted 3-demethylubiquinone-9 3-methyltransferase (glyoxalase superfamily)